MKTLEAEDVVIVVGALDALAAALALHDHEWTDGQRALYEQAIRLFVDPASMQCPEGIIDCKDCGFRHPVEMECPRRGLGGKL